jgi:hypothetical protein
MAQQIALLIHFHNSATTAEPAERSFICHYSSHILLHEKDTYSHLLNMRPVVVEATPNTAVQPPIGFKQIESKITQAPRKPCAVVLECPHREIGGKCTPYADLEHISQLCRRRGVAFHMDDARLWEAIAHYTSCTTSTGAPVTALDLCGLFDSIYVSCYKGIGGMTGAVLLGSAQFIAEARVWLRRFGGNVFTLLPYAVSSYASYRNYVAWNSASPQTDNIEHSNEGATKGAVLPVPYSMHDRLERMQHVIGLLSAEPALQGCVRFDPPVPEVCLVHVYIKSDPDTAVAAHERSKAETGVSCFPRLRPAPAVTGELASTFPQESYFEFNMV